MTREGAIGNLIHAIRWNDMPKKEALDMAIKVLKQEPCEDAISRANARHLIAETNRKALGCMSTKAFKILYDGIDALPPVTPQEPKTGYWIEERTYMECPNCHDIWHYEENQTERFKFCPTCGMRIK